MNIRGMVGVVCALLTATSFGLGCGPGFNAVSGDDAKRAGAMAFAPGSPSDDRVSAGQGDHTDWKSFELDDDSNVRIRIWWDDPGVDAHVFLLDERAKGLADLPHEPDKRYDEMGPIGLPAGMFYVKIEAAGGASVYTLEVLTDEGAGGGGSSKSRPGF